MLLDPLSRKADEYILTGFLGNGRAMDVGDFNGDGLVDLAITSTAGELITLNGDGEDSFHAPSRSWFLSTVNGFFESRVHGLAVADLNRDGLSEVFVGDIGVNPQSLIVWLNKSR